MTEIPPITDPLGKHWEQPKLSELDVHDNQVRMNQKTFNKLHFYETSIPTGTYIGKMWRRHMYMGSVRRPLLVWFDTHSDLTKLSIKTRKIIIE